jgi:hypothetical protein
MPLPGAREWVRTADSSFPVSYLEDSHPLSAVLPVGQWSLTVGQSQMQDWASFVSKSDGVVAQIKAELTEKSDAAENARVGR